MLDIKKRKNTRTYLFVSFCSFCLSLSTVVDTIVVEVGILFRPNGVNQKEEEEE